MPLALLDDDDNDDDDELFRLKTRLLSQPTRAREVS